MKLAHLLLGRKVMTNLDSILKNRHCFAKKGPSSQSYGFSSQGYGYGCERWTVKKAEHWRIDAFELWCWRRFLRAPWTAKRSNQSLLKEINPEYSLAGLMLKLKLQYFGHPMQELTHWKRSWCWERLKVGGEGDDRGWDGWMASPTQWTWVWVSSGGWWWTGRPGGLQSMGSQRVGHDWATELNWTDVNLRLENWKLCWPVSFASVIWMQVRFYLLDAGMAHLEGRRLWGKKPLFPCPIRHSQYFTSDARYVGFFTLSSF